LAAPRHLPFGGCDWWCYEVLGAGHELAENPAPVLNPRHRTTGNRDFSIFHALPFWPYIVYGAATTRVVNWAGVVHPQMRSTRSTRPRPPQLFLAPRCTGLGRCLRVAWHVFPPAGVLQNAKVLACVQGGPCNHGLDLTPSSALSLHGIA
jgi:hypothetical protein